MDDTSNRLVVDFARPLQVGEKTSEEDDTPYPLEFKMQEPKDSEADTIELIAPGYEILMNYGVWPSGDSNDVNYALGDILEKDSEVNKPWTITMPLVQSSSVTAKEDAAAE